MKVAILFSTRILVMSSAMLSAILGFSTQADASTTYQQGAYVGAPAWNSFSSSFAQYAEGVSLYSMPGGRTSQTWIVEPTLPRSTVQNGTWGVIPYGTTSNVTCYAYMWGWQTNMYASTSQLSPCTVSGTPQNGITLLGYPAQGGVCGSYGSLNATGDAVVTVSCTMTAVGGAITMIQYTSSW